ncbi:MAG: carbohydrate kinase family protein [Capsulimonadales bacterium]|nr:carbohydrate kinase family protein [Capsulimonadales bacterium]
MSTVPRSPEVVVYGTVCLDILARVRTPDSPMTEAVEFPGGEAFNTATALAGWEVNVLLTGTAIGADVEGDRLRQLLDHHPLGLPRTFVPDIPTATTPVCQVRVTPDGERYMSGRGFREAVAPPPLPEPVLATRPIFAVDPNLGEAAVLETVRAASFGCSIVAMDFGHREDIVALSRIVVESRERLLRQGRTDPPETLAAGWVAAGAQTAIVTLGAEGCVVADRADGVFPVPAFSVSPIVDTTGAGDTFRAGLCYGLLRGMSLQRTVRFATAAAALHCQTSGGGSRIPISNILALMDGTS